MKPYLVIGSCIGIFLVLTGCSSGFIGSSPPWTPLSETKANIIKREVNQSSQGIVKIDYAPTYTGFTLESFIEDPKILFSGSTLKISGKSITGSLSNEEVVSIQKDISGWYFIRRNIAENTPLRPSSESGDRYALMFLPGFSKMKFLGQYYAYKEENLTKYGNEFSLKVFISGKKAYVLQLENVKEKASRQKLYDEFIAKIEALKQKYPADPLIINTFVDGLREAYDIRPTYF